MAKIIKFRDSSEQPGSARPDAEELELQLRFHRIAMRQLLARPIGRENGHEGSLSASIGIATPDPGTEPEQLTALADAAIYRASGPGKNRFAFAGEEKFAAHSTGSPPWKIY